MLEAIIIGLVEGLTEFLPVSSTGHLLIAEYFLESHKSDAFNVLIQMGPIVASVLVFWQDILKFFTEWKNPEQKDYALKLAVSFFITCAGGFIAKKMGLKLPETILPVTIAVIVGAFIIIFAERKAKTKKLNSNLTWAVVVAVALGQIAAAVFPGASRSGMAIMGALLLGFARPDAVKFAFLVGIPTMFAAGGYQLLDAIKDGQGANLITAESMGAFAVATISAWLSVVWLLRFVQTNTFIPFAIYRLLLGAVLLAVVL
ncbi:undecaprenyl-diphosphatase [Fibrobacterales bacterium]|nr:undecaprenyl-diphosphatase [Fibrobacterales bacterium]GHV15736.1 undecaprenyl-diphosphatase [Fibrobacterales bacterium]